MDFSIFQQLGTAFILASLIGLEREQRYQIAKYEGFGGIRTFALIGLMGALAYILSIYSVSFFVVITAGFMALLITAYFLTARKDGNFGVTSEVAAILVYIIGVLAAMDLYVVVTIVALAVLTILHFKDVLHKWAYHIQNKELVSTIQFMIIAFVVLPILPSVDYGPYGFFNPQEIWLMVVFISGISFASYVAIKLVGEKKGIALTGFLAGFISSTALAFSFSGESKKNTKIVNPYALAVIVASTAMFFRVLLEVFVLNSELFKVLYVPILAMGLTGIASAFYFWRKKDANVRSLDKDVLDVKSPFNIVPALKFSLLFALILLVSKFALVYMGNKGVYLTSLLSGLLDVDAITLSMSRAVADGDLATEVGTFAILIAAMTNTLVKGVIMFLFGSRKVALRVISTFAVIMLVGFVAMFLVI